MWDLNWGWRIFCAKICKFFILHSRIYVAAFSRYFIYLNVNTLYIYEYSKEYSKIEKIKSSPDKCQRLWAGSVDKSIFFNIWDADPLDSEVD